MMEMPKLVDQHRKLQSLAGSWSGEEKLYPSPWDPKGGAATGRIEARVALDGFFVVSDYVEERSGQVSYRGHGVFGWDPAEKCYTMNWFDSMGSGSAAPARGQWEGDVLTFEHRTPMGHARYVYDFEGDRKYSFRIEQSRDGKDWSTFMEGTYTRK